MSRTNRKIPHWAKGDPELEAKFKRGKFQTDIYSGTEPHEIATGKKGKRWAKKMTRRQRRQGKIPTNFKK